jgi:hypothetical protein
MKMHALVVVAALAISTGAAAQQYNGFPPPEPPTGNLENIEPLYNFARPGTHINATAMQRIRSLCASDSRSSEQRCALVKRAMDQRLSAISARQGN